MAIADHEDSGMSRTERAVWLRTLAAETRTDVMSTRAKLVITATLDGAALEEGNWCACPSHEAALAHVLSYLWRDPPA
jgi:hypothetical protein